MAKADFVEMDGDTFFLVGGKNRRAYSTAKGQKEIYRDENLSLHVTPHREGWTGCRLYLLGARRKAFHFSVNVELKRACRSSEVFRIDQDFPGVVDWVVDYVCGEQNPAPDISRQNSSGLNDKQLSQIFRLVDVAFKSGCGWNMHANTKKDGRYIFENLKNAMPGIQEVMFRDAVSKMLSFDAVEKYLVDSRKKKYALRANVEGFINLLKHDGWLDEEELSGTHEEAKIVLGGSEDIP